MKTVLTAILLLIFFTVKATNKTVIGNAGQGWSNASNFSPAGVPQNNDVITIPIGMTITVKGSIYSDLPFLKIYIYGTLNFAPSGRLDLGPASIIQLFTGGQITTAGSSSELITIGGVVKYNGHNDGAVSGPAYASAGTASSLSTLNDGGFVYGVLPIRLHYYSLRVLKAAVCLSWKLTQDSEHDQYIVQRMINGSWQDISVIKPTGFTTTELNYSFTDNSPAEGINLYRLKLQSINGQPVFSKVLTASIGMQNVKLLIYPNPVQNEAVMSWKESLSNADISIMNASGIVIIQKKIPAFSNTFIVDLSTLKMGIYYMVLSNQGQAIEKTSFMKMP